MNTDRLRPSSTLLSSVTDCFSGGSNSSGSDNCHFILFGFSPMDDEAASPVGKSESPVDKGSRRPVDDEAASPVGKLEIRKSGGQRVDTSGRR